MSKEIIPQDNSLAGLLQRALYNFKTIGFKAFDGIKSAFGIPTSVIGPDGEGGSWDSNFLRSCGVNTEVIPEERYEQRQRENAKKLEILEQARARAHKDKIDNTVKNLKEGQTENISLNNLGEVLGAFANENGPDVDLNPPATIHLGDISGAISHAKEPVIEEPEDGRKGRRRNRRGKDKDIDRNE